jgi:GT2 family glycosyltransferase
MRKYSIIIFVDNHWDVIPLLKGLVNQTLSPHEILIIDECISGQCKLVENVFTSGISIRYLDKNNRQPGYSRNFGFDEAKGDYFIVFDSHCEISTNYLEKVDKALTEDYLDSFVGPFKSMETASLKEKAINYALTIFYSLESSSDKTKEYEKLLFNSFNFGLSREVVQKTGGYVLKDHGDDLELGLRIKKAGFKVGVIKDAYVYHNRIKDFKQLFQEMNGYGKGRVNVYRLFPKELKTPHFFPFIFLCFCLITFLAFVLLSPLYLMMVTILVFYSLFILIDSTLKIKNIQAGLLSIPAVFIELWGYGMGFISEFYRELSGTKKSI